MIRLSAPANMVHVTIWKERDTNQDESVSATLMKMWNKEEFFIISGKLAKL